MQAFGSKLQLDISSGSKSASAKVDRFKQMNESSEGKKPDRMT